MVIVPKTRKRITASLVPEEEVITSLRQFVQEKGNQALAAEALGVTPPFVSLILHGERGIPDQIAEKLGYRRIVLFEKMNDAGPA